MNAILDKLKKYVNPMQWFKREEGDSYLRAMHSINKISIVMFLICIAVLAVRHFTR